MFKPRVYQYRTANGAFDYERYRSVQTSGNKAKIDFQWVQERTIAYLAAEIRTLIGQPKFGICHGTRRGAEQAWFAEHLDCKVVGTEISDTAGQFPNTVRWDFHEVNPEWSAQADFVYSNSWDHAYDPEKMIDAWVDSLRPSGICIFEHSDYHVTVTELDPFGATLAELCALLNSIADDRFFTRDVWTGAGSQISHLGNKRSISISHVVIERLPER